MKKNTLHLLLLTIAGLLMTACGGGADTSRPQKTATITFSTSSSTALPATINGIIISAKLPVGASVTPDLDPQHSGMIDPNTIRVPKDATLIPSFTTSPSGVQTVTIGLFVSETSQIPLGDFAQLTCKIAPGSTLTEADFLNVNNPFPQFQAGHNNAGLGSDLPMVTPQLKVTFNN